MTTEQAQDPVARTSWSAVLAVSLGIVLVALDMTIVAVALPTLGADFHAGASTTQWVILAYTLPVVALSVPAGRWLDRAGPRPSFLLAVGGFGVTSVLIAAAPSMAAVLVGRVLQGMFGSLIGVVGMPLVASLVRPEHRARAMSIVLTLIPLSGAAGPGLGGLLSAAYGWRAVFLVNIPVVLLAVFLAVRTIPARLPGRSGLPLPGKGLLREAAVLATGVTAVLLALDMLGGSGSVVGPAVLAGVAVVAIAAWARLPESRAVRSLLRRRALLRPLTALPLMTSGVAALNLLVPYFLADVLRASPRLAGVVLLTMSAGMAACSPIAGVLADRFGTYPLTVAGAVTALAGMLALLFVDAGTAPLGIAWRLAVVGIGNGLFAGPNTTTVLRHTPPELIGTSSGVTALLRTFGFSIGPAVAAPAWSASSGGSDGFHNGVTILTIGAGLALALTLSTRARRRATASAT